jgi:hypothetical protein
VPEAFLVAASGQKGLWKSAVFCPRERWYQKNREKFFLPENRNHILNKGVPLWKEP